MTSAERLYLQLKTLTVPADFSQLLRKRCLVALTHFSTQIEGNRLSLEQVEAVVEHWVPVRKTRDEREVHNYFTLLNQLSTLEVKESRRITSSLICEFHRVIQSRIVEGELLGRFRTVQNAIYDSHGGLVYLPPLPADVPELVDDLCHWANESTLHPVLVAAILHNQCVTIHPFVDGNGRTARALSLYWLLGHEWDLRQWVPIDRYYADDRASYYSMLQQSYSHNYYEGRHATDFTRWSEYYVEGLRTILEETLEEIARFQDRNILLNARQKKVVLNQTPTEALTPRYYAARFHISTRMASRDLRQLLTWGFLRQIGQGRSARYVRMP